MPSFEWLVLLLLIFVLVPFVLTVRRSKATDSPWFWAYYFGLFALVALSLAAPKYALRQAEIERQFQGRQRGAQISAGEEPDFALSTPEDTIITLTPLYIGLGAATVVAWAVYWYTSRASFSAASASLPAKSDPL